MERLALSIPETAEALGCARGTVYKLIEEGRLRRVPLGGSGSKPVIPMSSIHEFLGDPEAPTPTAEEVAWALLNLVGSGRVIVPLRESA